MMNLNLQILQIDLQDIVLRATIIDKRLERRLGFAVIYDGEECPLGDRLYLTRSSDLPPAVNFSGRPSFLCIGNPPERYVNGECNILILLEDISITHVTQERHYPQC
jgi:hypothetical protein